MSGISPAVQNPSGAEPSLEPGTVRGRKSTANVAPLLLPKYLREMGQIPLIAAEEEVRLGREIQHHRAALARLARRLPARFREYVLDAGTTGPGADASWSLCEVESFYEKLGRLARFERSPVLQDLHRTARPHKVRLEAAREQLILANLRLVVHIAKRYVTHGVSLLDLIQEGNIGLMRAVEKFEYQRGTKFSTYAYWWIKQAIERSLVDKSKTIRIPVHLNETRRKVTRVRMQLSHELRREPTSQEIAKRLQLPVPKVDEVLGLVQDPRSLEEFAAEGNSPDLLQTLEDPAAVTPQSHTERREVQEKIEESLRELSPREAEIICLRFGIGKPTRTLDEIGERLHVSRERVRQIQATALKKLGRSDVLATLVH